MALLNRNTSRHKASIMTTFSFTTETLDNTTYFSTTTGKSTTTMFVMNGTTFVAVNMSPPKALQDIAKQSKAVKNLLVAMSESTILEAEEKNENPRYTAFKRVKPNGKNFEFLDFIAEMKNKYFNIKDASYFHILDQDNFSDFIISQVTK